MTRPTFRWGPATALAVFLAAGPAIAGGGISGARLAEPSTAMHVFAQEPIADSLAGPPLLPSGPSLDLASIRAGPSAVGVIPPAKAPLIAPALPLPESVPTPADGCSGVLAALDGALSRLAGARPACPAGEPAAPAGVRSPALVVVAVMGISASASGLALTGGLALSPLFSRISKERTLRGRREEIFDLIRGEPGIHLSDVAKRLDCGWGTVLYHLSVLERTGYVTVVKEAGFKRYFPTGEYNYGSLRTLYALKGAPARTIYDAIRSNPGINGVGLAEKVGVRPASLARPVAQLVALGIVLKERRGREVKFYLRAEDAAGQTDFDVVGVTRPVSV